MLYMPGENVSVSVRTILVNPKSLRMDGNEGSEAIATTEKSMTGAEISKEISVRVTRLRISRFLFFSFFSDFLLLFLLNLISAR